MKVLILGAGSSQGTFGDRALGVTGFLDCLSRVRPDWVSAYQALARVVDDTEQLHKNDGPPSKPGLDDIWTRIDYYAKLSVSLRRSDYGEQAAYEMYRAVIDVYGLENEIARLPTRAESGRFTLLALVSELLAGDALVSFNWDVAAEHLATRVLKVPLLQAPYPDIGQPHIRVIKPHGSLSWRHEGVGVAWHDRGAPKLDTLDADSIGRSQNVVPLILGAVPIKSELLREVQGPHQQVFDLVSAQWAEAASAIERASEVVIAGYGFPPEDAYGRFLLREAVRRRSLPPPSIRFYELCETRGETIKSIKSIWGPSVSPKHEGEVVPP